MIPRGVQGENTGVPAKSRPRFAGWNPSTSFPGRTDSITCMVLTCAGSGSWTRIPETSGSLLSTCISRITSFVPELLRQGDADQSDMHLFARPVFHPHIELERRVGADNNRGKPGIKPGLINLLFQEFEPFLPDLRSIKDHLTQDTEGTLLPSRALQPPLSLLSPRYGCL